MTIELRQEGALIDGFKPGYFGCECSKKPDCGCPDTGDTPTPPGPEPPTPDTGITSIRIIVADTITDSGRASAVFTPSTADTSLYYSSSDDSIAEIDPDTGEITVIQTGVVTFCVEDLYTGLEDCKEVNVIKSEDPDTGDTGSTDTRLKVIYYRRANDTTKLLNIASGITRAEFEDGTVIENPGDNFTHSFETEGLHIVYYTLQSNELNDNLFHLIFGVQRVEIPSGVTRIGESCFSGCKSFLIYPDVPAPIEFVMPNTIVEFDDYAFAGVEGNFVVPAGVKRIGKECFVSDYLTSLTIPSTVVSIGDSICRECKRLETVNILCNVSVFDNQTLNHFIYCPSLSSFFGPSASADHRMLITDDNVAVSFAAGGGLRNYTTPLGIEKIGRWCFASDRYVDEFPTQIEEITVSEGVKYIEEYAFYCHNLALRRVNLPSTLLDISGEQVFYGRTNLADIYCSAQTAPLVGRNTFYKYNQNWFPNNGTLHYPAGSNYSSWLSNNSYYLGYYGWTGQEITG